MFGVDPSCLGGISTLTRMLSRELSECEQVDFNYIVTVNQSSKFDKISVFLRAISEARLQFQNGQGIVHIHMADNSSVLRACLIMTLAKKYKQIVVLHVHCDLFRIRESSSKPMKRLINWTISNADHLIFLGSYLYQLSDLLGVDRSRVTVLPNAVECPQENPYEEGRNRVLFLGNVSADKGVIDLLDAIQQLKGELNGFVEFDLCGKDHLNVQNEIDSRGLSTIVHYLGIVKPCPSFFSRYMLNVLPSHKEAMPFSLLEASAQGIPSVATSVGSIPEIIEPGVSGYLCEPDNVDDLSFVLKHALHDEHRLKTISDGAFSTASHRFSMDSYKERLLHIYSTVMERYGN